MNGRGDPREIANTLKLQVVFLLAIALLFVALGLRVVELERRLAAIEGDGCSSAAAVYLGEV